MDLKVGDQISFILRSENFYHSVLNPVVLLALATATMDNVVVDLSNGVILIGNDNLFTFESLGLGREHEAANDPDTGFIFNFENKVSNIYEAANGKYGSEWGDAVFIDCNFVFE